LYDADDLLKPFGIWVSFMCWKMFKNFFWFNCNWAENAVWRYYGQFFKCNFLSFGTSCFLINDSGIWMAHFVGDLIKCMSSSNSKNTWWKRTQWLKLIHRLLFRRACLGFSSGKYIAFFFWVYLQKREGGWWCRG